MRNYCDADNKYQKNMIIEMQIIVYRKTDDLESIVTFY